MADKTIALKISVEGNKDLERLQANFDKSRRDLKALTQTEKAGTTTVQKANAARAKLNVELIKNRNALRDQQNAILKNNNALKKNSGFVAGIKKGVGQWATSMIGVGIAIGAVTKLVGSAIGIIKDFEKANSQLRAVLGGTNEEMKELSNQAKELGATTAFTASQVTELQTEFAKLGFPTEDILDMTEATLNGAAALGSDLGEQAALTGALLKQYGLDAKDAAAVNDTLATAAAKSALDFGKLQTALPIVGATAAAVGQDLDQTTVLLGKLSDRGLDASTSGTSLRNVFLELSKQGLTMDEAMAKINGSTDKAKTSMELFGKRGATAGLILADTNGVITDLETALVDADGAAKEMADTMLDNLAGDITKANSAWEGFILSIEDGEGVISEAARSITSSFTGVLNQLTLLNNGDFDGFAASFLESTGAMSGEQANFQANLSRSSEIIEELQRQLDAGTITQKKYNESVIAIGNGWERTKEKIEEEPIKAEVDIIIDGEKEGGTELTPAQLKAIEDKAKATAKAKKEAQIVADRQIETVAKVDTGLLDAQIEKIVEEEDIKNAVHLEKQKEFQEMSFIEKQLFLAREAELILANNAKQEEDDKKLAQVKMANQQAQLSATAGFLNATSGLMKEGSQEQKALASAGAIISTYAAAAAALAPPPIGAGPIVGPLVAGAAIANGLASVARINGVKFEDGGILKGASHANGGIPFTVAGQGGFEAEGGEAIINKRSTAMFAPLLNDINQAGGGARLFANGGLTPSSTGVTASQQQLSGATDMDAFADRIIDGFGSVEVVNVATNTSEVANEVQNVTQTATF